MILRAWGGPGYVDTQPGLRGSMNYNGKQCEESADVDSTSTTKEKTESRWAVCGPEIWYGLFNSLHGSSQGSEDLKSLTISTRFLYYVCASGQWIGTPYIFFHHKPKLELERRYRLGVAWEKLKIRHSFQVLVPSEHRKSSSHLVAQRLTWSKIDPV